LIVKAGKDRENPSDNITILGTITGAPDSFANIENLNVQIASGDVIFDDLNLTIPINTDPGVKLTARKGVTNKLKFLNSSESIIIIILDLATGKFSFLGRKIDLTGLKDSISIDFSLDDFSVSADVDEDIINSSKKLIPLCFLSGHTDALRVTQAKVGKNADSLLAKGAIALKDPVNLETEAVTVSWGPKIFTIPADNFVRKGTGGKYICKKFEVGDGSTINGKIDLGFKSSFSLKVKKAAQPLASTGTVTFGISFTGFSEAYDWIFPAP
jgi:hypothetical protein